MLTTEKINNLLGIKESYQASDALMKILFEKEQREKLFNEFLEIEWRLDRDWFHIYFEEEHANKLKYAQDFTPDSVSLLLSKLIDSGGKQSGMRMDVASGTGKGKVLNIKKCLEQSMRIMEILFGTSRTKLGIKKEWRK